MSNEPDRLTIKDFIDCDTQRLYSDIDEAIRYLTEMRDKYPNQRLMLNEHWFAYEEMEMRFYYDRQETDLEYFNRKEKERLQREEKENRLKAKEQSVREKKLKQFERLKNELGL